MNDLRKIIRNIILNEIRDDDEVIGALSSQEEEEIDSETGSSVTASGGGSGAPAQKAEFEWKNIWNQGTVHEKDQDPNILSRYWNAARASDYGTKQPWSAAFISFLMQGDPDFKTSSGHVTYMRNAKKNRDKLDAGENVSGYVAFKPGEKQPSVGDLVCNPRGGSGDGWSSIGSKNHCDIYVGGGKVVGGNTGGAGGQLRGNTVGKKNYKSSKISMVISKGARVSEATEEEIIREIIIEVLKDKG